MIVDSQENASTLLVNIVACAERHMGSLTMAADHSSPHGEGVVVEVETADRRRCFLKSHYKPRNYEVELETYRTVIPYLQEAAPKLLAFDDEYHLLVLSALPGTRADRVGCAANKVSVHRHAGELLRKFHSAVPAVSVPDWAGQQRRLLEEWIGRDLRGVLHGHEIDYARSIMSTDSRKQSVEAVWAHRDWGPRNWIVNGDLVYAVDFEHARRESWVADLVRLWWGEWVGRPDLQAAFLEGYGHCPSPGDMERLSVISVVTHISTIVWALNEGAVDVGTKARRSLETMRNAGPCQ